MSTVRDVARRAGVSISLASAALRNARTHVRYSEETRARVVAAAETLGYRRHPLSTALRTGHTHIIGLSLGDASALLRHPHSAQTIAVIQAALAARGYATLMATLGGAVPCDLRLLDGVIVMGYARGEEAVIEAVAGRMPLFHWMGTYSTRRAGITCDGGRLHAAVAARNHELAARYLYGLGHRRIALVEPWGAQRTYPGLPVFENVARQQGIEVRLTAIYDYLKPRTYPNTMRFLDGPELPTAFYALDDEVAQRIIDRLSWRGLSVPRDASVFSRQIDDVDLCSTVGMTGVVTEWPHCWRHLVDQYVDVVEGKRGAETLAPMVPDQRVFDRTTCARPSDGGSVVRPGGSLP